MTSSKGEIEQLIFLFSKLPGLGVRSARRIVLHLLQDKDIRLNSLIEGLSNAASKINNCTNCGNIDITEICNICADSTRDSSVICIVETVAELWAIERSEVFKGRYHVLGSNAHTTSNRTPTMLELPKLLSRCEQESTKEILLAMNTTLEGQTTAYYITEYFKNSSLSITRLASGIPFGGELDYYDEGTLSAAISLRRPFE